MPNASILIVDDDSKNRIALSELLQSAEHDVVVAESGNEALRHVLKQDFAVILLDVRMPGLDGFETAKLIRGRERSQHTPIIFLTGADEDLRSMFHGYEVGAVDYILKPPIPEALKSKVSVFVELDNKNSVLTQEIAERKYAEERLKKSEENLRALAARLQLVREEERVRISREIHDELGQALTGLKMEINAVMNQLPRDEMNLAAKVEPALGQIDGIIQIVRRIASGLRPVVLDQLGLTAAIEWQTKEFLKRTGIRCELSLSGEVPALDQERSTAAFRIFQELLTNVARHARATRVEIEMRLESDTLILSVNDNGKGIASTLVQSPKSLGLLGMRERILPFGGSMEIVGSRNKGTRAKISIPLGLR
ncbi:MAG: response regulator [Betaproteobacteria bacterium]|nr:response regulator [Betaproteobacteria bacterium]